MGLRDRLKRRRGRSADDAAYYTPIYTDPVTGEEDREHDPAGPGEGSSGGESGSSDSGGGFWSSLFGGGDSGGGDSGGGDSGGGGGNGGGGGGGD